MRHLPFKRFSLNFCSKERDKKNIIIILRLSPPPNSPIIGFVSNIVYGLLVKLNCCKPAPRNYDIEIGVTAVPGSARAEAERRR